MVNLRETKYVLSETKTTPKTTLLSTAPFRHLLAEPLTDRGNFERDSPESYWLWQRGEDDDGHKKADRKKLLSATRP
jgi:hypothetical protein